MFNSRRIKDLERSVGTLLEAYTRLSERLSVLEKPVSPAKKRGRPAKKEAWKKRVNKEINALPTKRKYVKSGKYAKKVTTKKK